MRPLNQTPINGKSAAVKCRVLVIDQDANHRTIYRRTLSHAGYEVYAVASASHARELLDFYHFDVSFTDIDTVFADQELELLGEQCALLHQKGTKIIMTGDEVHHRPLCKEMGADIFMRKPIHVRPLMTLVDCLTARQV